MGIINDDIPRKESFEFFEKAVPKHEKVNRLEKIGIQLYKLKRTYGDTIIIYLTNLYTVGLADYYDIIENHPNVNAIITISNWNGYTKQAKREAEKDNVDIYVFTEFMGALHWDEYVRYFKEDNKGRRINFGMRSS